MGLDFDITSTPPDTESIAAARAELAAERLRLRELNKRFLIVAVAIVTAIFCFFIFVAIPFATKPGTEGGFVFIIVYTLPYFFFSIFVVGNIMHHKKVDVPQKALRAAEAALQEGEPEDITELLDACRIHAPLGTYQSQVASQKRALFKGELEAMQLWLEAHAGQSRKEV